MSTYDVSLDDLAGRKVQRKRLGVGYARMHPYDQPRGRGPPPGLQARLGTAGRGKSRSSQLSRQDLRLTKLGLSTKKTDALAKGKFDLRQKLGGKETGQTSFRQITQGVVRSTFSKALEETYSTKEKKQTRLITRPLSPVRGNIKVTIKGLGKPEAAKPLHVDRTRDGSRQVASGVTYRAWEFQDKPKTAMFSSRQSQLPRLHYEDIDPAESPPPPAAPAPVQRPMFTERYTEERRRPAALMSGTKLIVSNLQPSVSHEDVVVRPLVIAFLTCMYLMRTLQFHMQSNPC
eukprot:m.189783 g.189783  ORF g.189783 m.189783 type:complete len:289 (+) comp39423_c1_seq5:20-886(+)